MKVWVLLSRNRRGVVDSSVTVLKNSIVLLKCCSPPYETLLDISLVLLMSKTWVERPSVRELSETMKILGKLVTLTMSHPFSTWPNLVSQGTRFPRGPITNFEFFKFSNSFAPLMIRIYERTDFFFLLYADYRNCISFYEPVLHSSRSKRLFFFLPHSCHLRSWFRLLRVHGWLYALILYVIPDIQTWSENFCIILCSVLPSSLAVWRARWNVFAARRCRIFISGSCLV